MLLYWQKTFRQAETLAKVCQQISERCDHVRMCAGAGLWSGCFEVLSSLHFKLPLVRPIICAVMVALTSILIALLFTACNCRCVSRQFTNRVIWIGAESLPAKPGEWEVFLADNKNLDTQMSLEVKSAFQSWEPCLLLQAVLLGDVLSCKQSFPVLGHWFSSSRAA